MRYQQNRETNANKNFKSSYKSQESSLALELLDTKHINANNTCNEMDLISSICLKHQGYNRPAVVSVVDPAFAIVTMFFACNLYERQEHLQAFHLI